MIRSLIARGAAALALFSLAAAPVDAQTSSSITVKDGAGASQTLGGGTANGKLFYGFYGADASGGVYPLASAATQAQMRTDTQTLAATVGNAGSPASTAQTVQPGAGSAFDTVVKSTATDIGATVTANTATTLTAANASRRGFTIQNQTSGACYLSGVATATADYHSLLIAAGTGYESKDSHVGTGALSVICAQAGGIYARQW